MLHPFSVCVIVCNMSLSLALIHKKRGVYVCLCAAHGLTNSKSITFSSCKMKLISSDRLSSSSGGRCVLVTSAKCKERGSATLKLKRVCVQMMVDGVDDESKECSWYLRSFRSSLINNQMQFEKD